jgi:DNA repair protein RadC
MSIEPTYSAAMREVPPEERPRERLMQGGAETLSDSQLLAILFRTGTRKMNAVRLAESVIQHFDDVRGLAHATLKQLMEVKGLGPVKAVEIKAALELGKRLAEHKAKPRKKIGSATDISDLLMIRFKDSEAEQFKVVLLSTKNEVIRIIDVSSGGLDATLALPRDVFRQAVRDGASAVIVCHNHPSGDPEPSREDIKLTERLVASADTIGIRLLDHVVFGDGRYVSLKERNLM